MKYNDRIGKIYDTIFFLTEYFNQKEIDKNFTQVYDDTSFMILCYDKVMSEVTNIPGYLYPLFICNNNLTSLISQFYVENFDFDNDNIESFIAKIISNSDKLKAKVCEQVFRSAEIENYIDLLENIDASLAYKLQISMLLGDFDHAIDVMASIMKHVYLNVEKLHKQYEHEIMSRFEQMQSTANIKAYQNFLKYKESCYSSTEVSISLLNQYIVYSDIRNNKFFMILGYKHEEAIGEQYDDAITIGVEEFILCCGNELRLKIIDIFCGADKLTASQVAQILDCPITTTVRHINQLRDCNAIFISKRDGLQIFYKLNRKLFKKMQVELNQLMDKIIFRKE